MFSVLQIGGRTEGTSTVGERTSTILHDVRIMFLVMTFSLLREALVLGEVSIGVRNTISLIPKEEEIWRGNEGALSQFGFHVESFGDRNYLLRALPVLVAKENIREVFTDLLDTWARKEDSVPWEEKIARSLSCHGAIKAGQQLTKDEMRELISQLEQSKQPRSCPHGRPTIIHMSLLQFEKEFGRRV